jgi:hypothetical protein
MRLPRAFLVLLIAFAIVQTLGAEELTRQGQRITWHPPSDEGKVAFVAAWVDSRGLLGWIRFHRAVVGKAGGAATWELPEPAPQGILLAAFDLESGAWSASLPVQPASAAMTVTRDTGKITMEGLPMASHAVVLLLRPKAGAWWLFSPDGSAFDHDGAENESQSWLVEDFAPFEGQEKLAALKSGDRLFVFELRSGGAWVLELHGED